MPGWDAATGLGSPNFAVLSNLVINPSSAFPAMSAYPNGGPTSTDDKGAHLTNDLIFAALCVGIISCLVSITSLWRLYQAQAMRAHHKGINEAAYASLDAPFLAVGGER